MNLKETEKKYILQTYKRYDLVAVKGRDKYVWDDRGKRYLDFFAGISVNNLGHCHPKVVAAIRHQAGRLIHASNVYYAEPQIELARTIVERSFPGQVFLSNSGAEANECAIKLARKWGKGKRYEIITFESSFHGRTLATLAATGQTRFRKGFEPHLKGFVHARYNDLASVKKLIKGRTVAVLVEPVQGEGGVIPATREFMKGLQALCRKHNLLFMLDEVQTGMGRTGTLFAYEQYGIRPDVVTLAKSLGGGLPLGATIIARKFAPVLGYSEHGSTFGGNPVACAASQAVFDLLTPGMLKKVAATGAYLLSRLTDLKGAYPCVREVRGMGLMAGIELDFPGKEIVQWCLDRGVLINCTQDTVLRFLPVLSVTNKDVDTLLHVLEDALTCHRSKK